MKGKLTFLFIQSRTGRRWRMSVSRNFLACMLFLAMALASAGIWGALKYNENLALKKKCTALEVERGKYEAVSRRIQDIEKDETAVRRVLGLQVPEEDAPRTGGSEKDDND